MDFQGSDAAKLKRIVETIKHVVGMDEGKAKKAIKAVNETITRLKEMDKMMLSNMIPNSKVNLDSITPEKLRIAARMRGFNPKNDNVSREIYGRFGSNLKNGELLQIAQVIANQANIRLDRDAKRRKIVLLKWFKENWPKIEPFLPYIVLEDSLSNEDSSKKCD